MCDSWLLLYPLRTRPLNPQLGHPFQPRPQPFFGRYAAERIASTLKRNLKAKTRTAVSSRPLRPTAGCLTADRLNDPIAHRAAELHDVAPAVARGVDAVGQQHPGDPALEIDPQAGAGEAGMADRAGARPVAAGPAVMTELEAESAGRRHRPAHRCETSRREAGAVEQAGGKTKGRRQGAEQAGMTGRRPQRKGILVMHLAAQQALAPGVALGCRGAPPRRIGIKAGRQWPFAERAAGHRLDDHSEQDEVDVGIDARAMRPVALEHVAPQRVAIEAELVERLVPWQEGLVAEALGDGQPAMVGPCRYAGKERAQRVVEADRA